MSGIAIVGMACRYADARSPQELWENVLARRRAFRRMPAERLLLRDYFSPDPATPDMMYAGHAALIEGYEFDRVRFRVAGPTFRSVDMSHWLALDVAADALADAGFADGAGLPHESTGVLVGNTLTGEFSRAAMMRLRWPYVRRVVEERLRAQAWDEPRRREFLRGLEEDYKSPFAPVGEETLAGALSNTIAGRICNHFHLGGGGYTLDGACCSSLLAVARACSALEAGEIDVALAGGVDLSLDPFELVGFAKAGALAHGEMLVYDRESTGFLPGEGSGFVVLMREEDASARGLRGYAAIRGWGISSDGAGSITRPEIRGQMLALERAYHRAGYGPETVALFEGHGTGTPVGDAVELEALSAVRRSAGVKAPPAAIASVKANIGHTKAAAGVAGLIKMALAVHHQVVPPATGVVEPRSELQSEEAGLRVAREIEPWPESQVVRAGVNSFGFGGINVHVTIEGKAQRIGEVSQSFRSLSESAQDAELFLLSAPSPEELSAKLDRLSRVALGLSYAELADASVALSAECGSGAWRAAIVAASPEELAERVESARKLIGQGSVERRERRWSSARGVFLGLASPAPRIGFLFPGQASPVRLTGGAHGRRFAGVRELYGNVAWPSTDTDSTHVAQVAIVTAELAGLRLLSALGIDATIAVGHSLGDLAAYCWAGAIGEESLQALVNARGRSMSEIPGPAGAMASVSATSQEVEAFINETGARAVVACFNAPAQSVVAGTADEIERLLTHAQARGCSATRLRTAHAFHSPLMRPAVAPFQKALTQLDLRPLEKRVVSTITGMELAPGVDLRQLMVEQLTTPVRFSQAMTHAYDQADLWIEVGPGQVLTHLVAGLGEVPAIALDVAGTRLTGVLEAVGAAYVVGSPVRTEVLFRQRCTRPFDVDRVPRFFVNPCELAPAPDREVAGEPLRPQSGNQVQESANGSGQTALARTDSAIEAVRSLLEKRTELPAELIAESAHLLRDLHLSSIVVGEIVAAAARELGLAPPRRLLEFADATVGETARALERMRSAAGGTSADLETDLAGVDDWQRAFMIDWQPSPLPRHATTSTSTGEWQCFPPHHPELDGKISQKALPGNGVIVCLPSVSAVDLEREGEILLQAAHAALEMRGKRYFVVIGAAATFSAFARTLHLEDPEILTRIIEAPIDSRLLDVVREEVAARGDCLEARYDDAGNRSQLCWRLLVDDKQGECAIPLGPGDVALVSGGGKGIVGESCRMLAAETGAAMVILGRSRPENDRALSAQLDKLATMGARVKYIVADVTDSAAVRAAAREAEVVFGPVTAIIHGAGRNQPRLLRDLDRDSLARTLAPKVQGLRNLLAAVDARRLRMLVTFGSVIGRAGLRGEADYALVNAFQSQLTEDFAHEHPSCRCLAFETSAWSGTGMAERLGTLDALRRQGISPIASERGVWWLRRLLSRPLPAVSVVVTGRLGLNPPVPIAGPSLPLLRFLEKPCAFYPGIELVVEAQLSAASDPYLMDHVFESQPLVPGVIGLEAMVQAATAVTGATQRPVLTGVRFERPLVVQPGARVTLRIAALVRESTVVDVVVRSSQTMFQVDHFRCTCDFREPPQAAHRADVPPASARLAVDPAMDLYGHLLFQTGRFRRLAGYRSLNARSCCAELAPATTRGGQGPTWFSQYLPGALLLGDPGARDAALHAVQASVPHAVLLPVGVERVWTSALDPTEEFLVCARRRRHEGKSYVYDVEIRTAEGALLERWEELELRQVGEPRMRAWTDALVAAYLEWRVEETIGGCGVAAAFDRDHHDHGLDRRARSERAIQKALDSPQPVHWRADGKPEVHASMCGVSAAHANGLTLAVAGPSTVACDLEPVCARSVQTWRDLLGNEHWRLAALIAGEAREDLDTAATRVWTAVESLKKAEGPQDGPLVLVGCSRDDQGCVSLGAPGLRIATSIVRFRDDPTPFAVSVLARSDEWVTTNTVTASALKRPTS